MTPNPDWDEIAEHALHITDRITGGDRRALFDETVLMCRYQPAQAAQVLLTLAAWHDHADPDELPDRSESLAHPSPEWWAVVWVCTERIPMALTEVERREVVRRLHGRMECADLAELIGLSARSVARIHQQQAAS